MLIVVVARIYKWMDSSAVPIYHGAIELLSGCISKNNNQLILFRASDYGGNKRIEIKSVLRFLGGL